MVDPNFSLRSFSSFTSSVLRRWTSPLMVSTISPRRFYVESASPSPVSLFSFVLQSFTFTDRNLNHACSDTPSWALVAAASAGVARRLLLLWPSVGLLFSHFFPPTNFILSISFSLKESHLADSSVWLFDCGIDVPRQFYECHFGVPGIHTTKVTNIFITHLHADHILGLPGFSFLKLSSLEYSGFL